MRVLATLQNENLLPWLQWRIQNPFDHMKEYGIKATYEYVFIGMPIPKDVDLLVFPRISVYPNQRDDVKRWLDRTKKRNPNIKFVYESDDDLWSESYVSQMYKTFGDTLTDQTQIVALLDEIESKRQNHLWMLQQCDVVTVSTKALGAYVQTLVDVPVYVIPNAIDDKKFCAGLRKIKRRPANNMVTIGWAGGKRNYSDIELMVEGWKLVARELKDKVQFVVAGWIPKQIEEDPDINRNLYTHSFLPTNQYARLMQVDIGCVSVDNSPFGSRKSPIKSWEFALAGATVIGTHNVYGEEPVILLVRDEKDWYQNIMYLVEDVHARESLGNAFRQHVNQHHLMKYEYHKWIEAYREIMNGVDPT